MKLQGRLAMITGAGGGLGRVLCRAFAEAGADVAVVYCAGAERAEAVCEEVRSLGCRAEAFALDQSDPVSAAECVAAVEEAFGRIDVLVNNAAMAKGVPFPDLEALTPEVWARTMEVNLAGPWHVSRAAAPALRRSSAGRIVNIAAMAGMKPMGASIAQSVSKAGVIQLTRCLAVALAPDVTVNCVAPGLMEGTLLTANMSDAFRDGFANAAALKRTTSLEDVAAQAVTFATQESATGQTMVVDGGVFFH